MQVRAKNEAKARRRQRAPLRWTSGDSPAWRPHWRAVFNTGPSQEAATFLHEATRSQVPIAALESATKSPSPLRPSRADGSRQDGSAELLYDSMTSRKIECAVTCNTRRDRECCSAFLHLSKIQGRVALEVGATVQSRRRDETARCGHPSSPGRTQAAYVWCLQHPVVFQAALPGFRWSGGAATAPLWKANKSASYRAGRDVRAEIPSACLGRSLSPPGGKECPALNLRV